MEVYKLKMLIKSEDVVSDYLAKIYNKLKNAQRYPKSLKIADVVPNNKNDEKTVLKDYRPVSIRLL